MVDSEARAEDTGGGGGGGVGAEWGRGQRLKSGLKTSRPDSTPAAAASAHSRVAAAAGISSSHIKIAGTRTGDCATESGSLCFFSCIVIRS